jgi:RNA polymerase I-specific transcription initiation factor RRN5
MSTTSLYEPDEDEEASDSDAINLLQRLEFRASSSLSRRRQSSSPEEDDDEEDDPSLPLSRASQTAHSRLRAIRRKGLTKASGDAYRDILDKLVDDLSPELEGALRVSYQRGIVTWTASEREIFFNLLTRKGKNGIREISNAIGSKSELEVQEYLKLLHQGLEAQQLYERHSKSTTFIDVPIAAEISEECCLALDDFSEYVALMQQQSDRREGMRKYGGFWIITRETARQVEQLNDEHHKPPSESSIFLTASLLNIQRWIQLSERFFMNFGESRIEDNWVNVAFKDESPSLTADAFADFYALAVSITRRIVQAALFFAMSRLRHMKNYQKVKKVRTRDIRAALDVLNMKHNTFKFWVGLARRCSLDVADIRNKKGWKADYMGYDEVEDALSGRRFFSKPAGRSTSRPLEENDDGDEEEDEDVEEESEDLSLSSPRSRRSSSHSLADSEFDEEADADEEDIYVEYIDQQKSRDEELRIRELLHCPIMETLPPVVKTEDGSAPTPPMPNFERKTKEDLIDWRDRTLYRSEWEEYRDTLDNLNEDLAENRRKRRRIGEYEHEPSALSLSWKSELRQRSYDEDDVDMVDVSDRELDEESDSEEASDSDSQAEAEIAGIEAEAADITEADEGPVIESKIEEDVYRARSRSSSHLPSSSGHGDKNGSTQGTPPGSIAQEDSDDGG